MRKLSPVQYSFDRSRLALFSGMSINQVKDWQRFGATCRHKMRLWRC